MLGESQGDWPPTTSLSDDWQATETHAVSFALRTVADWGRALSHGMLLQHMLFLPAQPHGLLGFSLGLPVCSVSPFPP